MESLCEDTLESKKKTISDRHDYHFLIEFKAPCFTDFTSYRHDFLGLPNIPMLGKYSGSSYEFGRSLSLVSIDMKYDSSKENKWSVLALEKSKICINIPQAITEMLLNIPSEIEENKKEEENLSENSDGKKQKKMTDFFVASNNQQKPQSFKKPTFFPTEICRLNWTIIQNNISLNQKEKDNSLVVYNYVMHTILFPVLNFEKSKRITARTPIALIISKNEKENNGIFEYIDSDKSKSKYYSGLKANDFRVEYSSAHLGKGGALCFSPNNMKIVLDRNKAISFFWTIVLDETMQANQCNLHWVINDQILAPLIEDALKNSQDLNDLMKNLVCILGDKNEALNMIKNIFFDP